MQCLLTGCLSLLAEPGRVLPWVCMCACLGGRLGAPVGLCSGRGRGLASGAIHGVKLCGWGAGFMAGSIGLGVEGSAMGTIGVLGLERADTAQGSRPRWIDGGGFWNRGSLEMPPASPEQHRPVSSGPPSQPKHATALSRSRASGGGRKEGPGQVPGQLAVAHSGVGAVHWVRFNGLCGPCPCSQVLDLVPPGHRADGRA